MDETQRCSQQEEIRQGDILSIECDEPSLDFPRLGVVINADCDLAHKKIDGTIAFLPLYSFADYLTRFWIPSFVTSRKNELATEIARFCKLDSTSQDDLLRWLVKAEPDTVSEKLQTTLALKPKTYEDVSLRMRKLHRCLQPGAKSLATLAEFARDEKDEQTAKRYLKEQIEKAKKNLGDGHFFISDVKGEEDIGFIVRMRRIYTLDASCCFTGVAQQRAQTKLGSVSAARICRLTPLYQFKVAQLFAHQFSRIGLPDETTALGDIAIDDMATKLMALKKS
ncbi:hypothetical protein [Burkholderia pseudomallei]|uniref:hypothetical protein n=1 Tax=Burkholderia pseudomallei TaxID=28450 RepID=UPI00050E75D8|nr:hypothetical protein [Burkholderia pseudomallei]KGD36071.1 hypothetical protein DO72_1477 [Burkholderia pseudomallei]